MAMLSTAWALCKEGYQICVKAIADYNTATFWLIFTLIALAVLR